MHVTLIFCRYGCPILTSPHQELSTRLQASRRRAVGQNFHAFLSRRMKESRVSEECSKSKVLGYGRPFKTFLSNSQIPRNFRNTTDFLKGLELAQRPPSLYDYDALEINGIEIYQAQIKNGEELAIYDPVLRKYRCAPSPLRMCMTIFDYSLDISRRWLESRKDMGLAIKTATIRSNRLRRGSVRHGSGKVGLFRECLDHLKLELKSPH